MRIDLPNNVRAIGLMFIRMSIMLFNCSSRAVLNVSRDSMAGMGFSPATRFFEVAGAGRCLITDAWEGIDHFLEPDVEVLVAQDEHDVVRHVSTLTEVRGRLSELQHVNGFLQNILWPSSGTRARGTRR